MALVMTLDGRKTILFRLLNSSVPDDCVMHLFTNNYFPKRTSKTKNFVEAEGFGYLPKVLQGKEWKIRQNKQLQIEATYEKQAWRFDGALGKVYGYYVTNFNGDTVLWAERFFEKPDEAYNIRNDGDQIRVTPGFAIS